MHTQFQKISKFNFKIQDPNKQDKEGKVCLTVKSMLKVKYARLFFVKYFPKILITQVYVPTVRNKT